MTPSHILVVIGSDPALQVDLSAFRAVREQTGVGFTRLENPDMATLAGHIRRLRVAYGQAPAMHISAHMSPKGITLSDGLISAETLSAAFPGVPVLFLDGCQSTEISDQLELIPYVVTLLEDVDHESARFFAQLFWMAHCAGAEVPVAYDAALERLPDVGEYAFLHESGGFLAKVKGKI